MERRLKISAPFAFLTILLGSKYLLNKNWLSSFAVAIIWDFFFIVGMIIFIKWWTKKVEEKKKIGH